MPQRIVWATSRRDGVPWMGFVEGYPGWCKFEDVKSGEPCAAVCTRSEDAAWVCPLSYTLSDSRSLRRRLRLCYWENHPSLLPIERCLPLSRCSPRPFASA